MTDTEKREAARQFYNKWVNRGKEDEDDRSYWIDLLQDVMGIDHVTDRIEFQKKVLNDKGNLSNRIDAYIPESRVLIEQKSLGIDLAKPQPAHNNKTPYEQAKEYDNALPVSEKAKWIVLSNFAEIWIYDMDTRVPEPIKFTLADIPSKYSQFEFLVNQKQNKINQEMEISVKAGEFVGLIYDALYKQYINPDKEESLKSLNMLCVRLVFCLYAEDAHIFGTSGTMFHDYLAQFETEDLRKALIELFRILDTPDNKRDPYDTSDLSKFPYVNGGLFEKEDIEIPHFTDEIREVLLSKASEGFDWSQISPTIFGAVFESTLNPETRRSGGMHYTSIENIHKVIDPLFLDDLIDEYKSISEIKVEKTKKTKLEKFQNKLASLTWLDPACGSGNFLTETYLCIRRLENLVIRDILDCDRKQVDGQIVLGDVITPIKVSINQFYGIEINDFAVTVAKTALWIAESQMLKETEDIIAMSLDFLPLKTNAYIHKGNALHANWEDIITKDRLNYIMGNPPFVGYAYQSDAQKNDLKSIYNKSKNLDYVAGWFFKASAYMANSNVHAAFVSTNSITQGEQVSSIWLPLIKEYGLDIEFAVPTFRWDNEANIKAQVHCVIIGFFIGKSPKQKRIYNDSNNVETVDNINAYLKAGEYIFVKRHNAPISKVPTLNIGNMPIDDGNYLFSEEEMKEFIKKEPLSEKYFHPWYDSRGFINQQIRYCLWLGDCEPNELRKMPECLKRVEAVKAFRKGSKRQATLKIADVPTRFATENMPKSTYIAIPEVSSQKRRYIPMGYLSPDIMCSNKLRITTDATLYHFGVLQSNVHMAWMRTVCGRLKSDYDYSIKIVYNAFPWPTPTDEQKKKIEETAQCILDARSIFPNSSLADLYDPLTMPPELQKAHRENDKAVMQAYGFSIKDTSEESCVAALMKMYQKLAKNNKDSK